MNYSGKLNEYGQKNNVKVQYEEKSSGPDHQKMFTAQAVVNGKRYPNGVGKTKKEAKENAALKALGPKGPGPCRKQIAVSTLPTKISQINYQSWLNEHGQKNRVTYKPVESTREGTVNAQFCCNYISDDGKSYPVAYGKSKQEAKEKAAKLACEVLKMEKIYCTSGPNLNQGQRQTSSLECYRHSTSLGLSCHPSRTSIANPAGGRDSGSSLTPAFPALVFSHSSHLAGGISASKPVPAELNFFNKHKAELELRLSCITLVLSKLESCGILNPVERETVENKTISTSQNHALIVLLSRKGEQAQERFYEILKETDPYLVKDLEK